MICKCCEGSGKLGLQQEDCWLCNGSGYIGEKIVLNKYDVERGLNELIKMQKRTIEKINNTFAYTEDECKDRLELLKQRDYIDYILKYLFDLQTFQYTKDDFDGIAIE